MPIPDHMPTPAVAGGEVVIGSADPEIRDDALPIAPNYPWFYFYYPRDPGAWLVANLEPESDDDPLVGPVWLPKLRQLPVKPGIAGHRTRPRGADERVMYAQAHERVRSDGGVILPRELGYMIRKPCKDPRTKREGFYFMDAWSTPRTRIQGRRLRFRFDRQAHYRWLAGLMLEGLINPPDPDVVDINRGRLLERVHRRQALNYQGDTEHADRYVGLARDQADAAAEALVLTADNTPGRDATDPYQMEYRELQAAARTLGWKTGGKTKEALRVIVLEGEPPPPEVAADG